VNEGEDFWSKKKVLFKRVTYFPLEKRDDSSERKNAAGAVQRRRGFLSGGECGGEITWKGKVDFFAKKKRAARTQEKRKNTWRLKSRLIKCR